MVVIKTTALTETEQLENLESVVRERIKSFVEIGLALIEIRDKKLYRLKSETFEIYCEKQWGFTGRYARNLIESAEVILNLKSGSMLPVFIPENPRQAYEFSKLEPEKQIELAKDLQEIQDSGKQITAKTIKEKVDEKLNRPVTGKLEKTITLNNDNENISFAIRDIIESKTACKTCHTYPFRGVIKDIYKPGNGRNRERFFCDCLKCDKQEAFWKSEIVLVSKNKSEIKQEIQEETFVDNKQENEGQDPDTSETPVESTSFKFGKKQLAIGDSVIVINKNALFWGKQGTINRIKIMKGLFEVVFPNIGFSNSEKSECFTEDEIERVYLEETEIYFPDKKESVPVPELPTPEIIGQTNIYEYIPSYTDMLETTQLFTDWEQIPEQDLRTIYEIIWRILHP